MKKYLPVLLIVIGYWLLVIGNPQPANAQVTRFPPTQDQCNFYKVVEDKDETNPSCAICGDILFCYGNDYRLCAADPIFPAPNRDEELADADFLGHPGETVFYNNQTFPVPSGGVYYCASNVFGCNDPRCRGEGEGSISKGFEGTTQTVAKTDEAFGDDIEIKRTLNVGEQIGSFVVSIFSRISGGERKIDVPAPPIPSEDAISKLTPAGFNFRAETEPLSGRIFTPGCDVRAEAQLGNVSIESQGAIDYEADPTLGEKIARATVFQATGVPGHGTFETVRVTGESLPDKEGEDTPGKQLENCPPAGGDPTTTTPRTSREGTTVSSPNLLTSLLSWFTSQFGEWSRTVAQLFGREQVEATAVVKPRNFSQGYGVLGEKTVGNEGFYNTFIPNKDVLSDNPALVPNEFEITGETENKPAGVSFPKAGKVEDGYKLLQKSLYPESMQGEVEKLGY